MAVVPQASASLIFPARPMSPTEEYDAAGEKNALSRLAALICRPPWLYCFLDHQGVGLHSEMTRTKCLAFQDPRQLVHAAALDAASLLPSFNFCGRIHPTSNVSIENS